MKVTELMKELEIVLDEVGDVEVGIEIEDFYDIYYADNFEVLKSVEPWARYVTLSNTNIWKRMI